MPSPKMNIADLFENAKELDRFASLLHDKRFPMDYLRQLPNHGKSNTEELVALWKRMREKMVEIDTERLHAEIMKHAASLIDGAPVHVFDSCPPDLTAELESTRQSRIQFFSTGKSHLSDFYSDYFLQPEGKDYRRVKELMRVKRKNDVEVDAKRYQRERFRFFIDELTAPMIQWGNLAHPTRLKPLACYVSEEGLIRQLDASNTVVGYVQAAELKFLPTEHSGFAITYRASQVGKTSQVTNPALRQVGRPHLASYMRCRHAKSQGRY